MGRRDMHAMPAIAAPQEPDTDEKKSEAETVSARCMRWALTGEHEHAERAHGAVEDRLAEPAHITPARSECKVEQRCASSDLDGSPVVVARVGRWPRRHKLACTTHASQPRDSPSWAKH